MKIKSIKHHLQPYSIMGKRETTINHAFASAIAPNDSYDEKIIKEAVKTLEQNPDEDLLCAYCGDLAETWDHVFGLVKNSKFSGYGHTIGNLLPCCKKCNSEKGNKNWEDFIKTKTSDINRYNILLQYFKKYLPNTIDYNNIKRFCSYEINELEIIKSKIFELMKEADNIAIKVRKKVKKL